MNDIENYKKYDAYIAYHTEHEIGNDIGLPWIVNKLVGKVEEEWGKKLFIFDRNASVGGSKIGETIGGI